MPPSTLPDGRPDLGWCCGEHAVVAVLAFLIIGVKARWCTGKVMIGPVVGGVIYDTIPHDFVAVGEPIEGIFDSSLARDEIQGLPVRYASLYPNLAVALFNSNREPAQPDFVQEARRANKMILRGAQCPTFELVMGMVVDGGEGVATLPRYLAAINAFRESEAALLEGKGNKGGARQHPATGSGCLLTLLFWFGLSLIAVVAVASLFIGMVAG